MRTSLKFLLFIPVAVIVAGIAWYYHRSSRSVEAEIPEWKPPTKEEKEAAQVFAVFNRMKLWRDILNKVRFMEKPKSVLVGTNINLDLIVPFGEFIKKYDAQMAKAGPEPLPSDVISSLDEFFSTFTYFLSRGAAAERFVADHSIFENLTNAALAVPHKLHIGGNAALIAEFLSRFAHIDVRLYGPVGNKLRPLMSERLFHDLVEKETNMPDEIHLIIEYKAGQKFAGSKAPLANRFIVHHDISNSQLVHVNGFLGGVVNSAQPYDWSVLSGLHFLDSFEPEKYASHIGMFRTALENRKGSGPLHLELASMANADFLRQLYQNVITLVDSLGLNDQELMFLIKCIGGPEFQTNGVIDKMVEALVWLLTNVREQVKSERFLSRIHMHSHRFHVVATSKAKAWTGLAEGLLHGAYTAAVHACGSEAATLFKLSKAKFSNGTVLPHHDNHYPVISWLESTDKTIQIFVVPTILCRKPVGTVGLGDAISAASLVYTGMVMGK